MSKLTIDRQNTTDYCHHCGNEYPVSRGSVYEDNSPIALYIAGMHGCRRDRIVVLAIALAPPDEQIPAAITLQVQPSETEFEMWIVHPDYSPWRDHAYIGHMLTREEVLASAQKELFFQIADVIVIENPEVNSFLSTP